MLLGTWTRKLPPLPGELLTSCLVRNALAHGTSPTRFLSLFWPREQPWSVDIDRDRPGLLPRGGAQAGSNWPDMLADALGVPRAAVLNATLDGYRKVLAGRAPNARGRTPLVLLAGLAAQKRRLHALQSCPTCLSEGIPHFRRGWRLAFAVGCPRHGRPLEDACPRCGAAVAPHRTATARITDCHACLRPLLGRPGALGRQVPAPVAALQAALSDLLSGLGPAAVGPWTDRTAFDGVRCLIGIAATRAVYTDLRRGLGLPAADLPSGVRLYLEDLRVDARIVVLETVAAWLSDWPAGFHAGADAAGLTQRSFSRLRAPPELAAEVARLRAGNRRDNTWKPVLEEPVLRRLRRRDPAQYRMVRAERILAEVGRAQREDRSVRKERPRMDRTGSQDGRGQGGAAVEGTPPPMTDPTWQAADDGGRD